MSIACYALLALLDIAFRAMVPLFYSTPIEFGGLGQSPVWIGSMISVFGIMNGAVQAFLFPVLIECWGPRRVFIAGMAMFAVLFTIFPIINAVARASGISTPVIILVIGQLALSIICDMAYGMPDSASVDITELTSCALASIFMYIAAASPNKRSLGGTNGLAQVSASVVRAVGPAMSTSLFAASAEFGWLGGNAVYVILVFVTFLTLTVAHRLPEELWNENTEN